MIPEVRQEGQCSNQPNEKRRAFGKPAQAFLAEVSVDEYRFEAGAQSHTCWRLAFPARLAIHTTLHRQIHEGGLSTK